MAVQELQKIQDYVILKQKECLFVQDSVKRDEFLTKLKLCKDQINSGLTELQNIQNSNMLPKDQME